MYWLLKYARSVEKNDEVWSTVILLNPRRNAALIVNINYLLGAASARLSPIELVEILRSAVAQEHNLRQIHCMMVEAVDNWGKFIVQ